MNLHLMIDETPWLHSLDPEGSQIPVLHELSESDVSDFLSTSLPNVFIDASKFLSQLELLESNNPVCVFVTEQLQRWLEDQSS